jgi:hypothetical protein
MHAWNTSKKKLKFKSKKLMLMKYIYIYISRGKKWEHEKVFQGDDRNTSTTRGNKLFNIRWTSDFVDSLLPSTSIKCFYENNNQQGYYAKSKGFSIKDRWRTIDSYQYWKRNSRKHYGSIRKTQRIWKQIPTPKS